MFHFKDDVQWSELWKRTPRPAYCIFDSSVKVSQIMALSWQWIALGHSPIATCTVSVTLQKLLTKAYGLSWDQQHPTTASKLSTQTLVSRFCFLRKGPGLLGGVASFGAGAGRIEDEPGISHARMQESSQRKCGHAKETQKPAWRDSLPWTKSGQIQH